MKLYHDPLSSNARKAVMTSMVLGLAGKDVDFVRVDMRTRQHKTPEYLRVNPMGKVPTLVDGDFVLWESHAIMAYLADRKPGNTLLPADARARADVNRWLFWTSAHWSANIAILVNQRVIKKMMGLGDPDPAVVGYAQPEFERFAKVLDDQLATHDFVCGPELTLADLAIAAPLMYAAPATLPLDACASVQRWHARIRELDSWKATEPKM